MDDQRVALLPARHRPVLGPFPAVPARVMPVKYQPGHYVRTPGFHWTPDRQDADFRLIDSIAHNPNVTGFVLHLNWAYFERAPGDHAAGFRIVDAYLDRLAPRKHLILHVADRSFGNPTANVYPPYVINNGWVSVKPADQTWPDGLVSVAKTWQATVIDRLIAMSRAYAVRYDGHPRLAMYGLGGPVPHPQLKRWLTESKKAWTATPLRLCPGETDLPDLFTHATSTVVPGGVAIGGPDPELPLPDVIRAVPANRLFRGEGGPDLRGVVPFVGEVRELGLGNRYTETPGEIFDYFSHRMRCNYMIWLANTHVGGEAQQWPAILAYIDSIRGRITTSRPTLGKWE